MPSEVDFSILGFLGMLFAFLLHERETGPHGHGLETHNGRQGVKTPGDGATGVRARPATLREGRASTPIRSNILREGQAALPVRSVTKVSQTRPRRRAHP